MIVRARAPLRLGLAGGGTDVSPYCDIHGGLVLNATIDRYAYAVIRTLADRDTPRFVATDRGGVAGLGDAGHELQLHRAVYTEIVTNHNDGRPLPVELSTFCDAPVGSGLGASSTLVVAMVRAFAELLNLPLDDHEIARIAFKVERIDCGLQGGRQDQYSAAFGGFNFMEFHDGERAVINSLRIKEWIVCELEASLLLFYTGVSRQSAAIISDQSRNISAGDAGAIEAMHGLRREALVMKECLLRGDFDGIVDSMRQGWDSKKRTASVVSNPHIEEIYDAAMGAGALAGKISGAGGGGYMMFFVPPHRRMDVIRKLGSFEGQVSNCHFTQNGSQGWRA